MRGFIQDIRYAVRVLAAKKGFTAVAIITLALGIGVNTTIFSLVDAMILRPLPVPDNKSLVAVYNKEPQSPLGDTDSISYPDYVDYRDKNDVFSGMIAYGVLDPVALGKTGQAELATGDFVSGNYFDVLGVKAHLGTTFHNADDNPAASPVAVLSYWTWQRRFDADPNIVGRRVDFYNVPFTILGVLDKNFTGLMKGISPEFWIPLRQAEILFGRDANHLEDRRNSQLLVMGRLKPGVTINQAKANMASLARAIGEIYPETNKDRELILLPGKDIIFFPTADRAIIGSSVVLLALSGFVLLIACANLANLLLARASSRRREIAVRIAVGGNRWRIIRQVLTESTVLAVLGGAAALLIAAWCTGVLNVVELPLPIRIALGAQLDWRVLAFTFGVSVITGIIFGLLPALQGSNADVVAGLKDDSSLSRRGRGVWMRGSLVVGQLAVSIVLLVFAGLAVRSLGNAASVNPGFNPANVGVAVADPSLRGYDETRTRTFSRQLLSRVRALPGVQSASLAGNLPLALSINFFGYSLDGPETLSDKQWQYADGTLVSDDYFRSMQIPILEGREFSQADEQSKVQRVIVNQTMAERLWPGRKAVGQRIYSNLGGRSLVAAEVIGVVRDGKYRTLGEEPRPFIYGNLLQNFRGGTLIFRAANDLAPVFTGIRNVVREIDAGVPIIVMQKITDRMSIVLLLPRYAAMLFAAFGLLGTVLAVVGLYGVVSYSVSQRTHEIGIRMALGGQRTDVLKLVIREGMLLTIVGLGLGILLAAGVSRFISAILYGIGSTDPLTFGAISALMIAVAFIACYIPARRASRVDPMVALRYE